LGRFAITLVCNIFKMSLKDHPDPRGICQKSPEQ
jgi:hypothetical protein